MYHGGFDVMAEKSLVERIAMSRSVLPVSLRPVAEGDGEFLFRVYAGTRQEELALVDWEEAQKEAFLMMQFTAQQRFYSENYPVALFRIITLDGVSCGRLYLVRWDNEIRIIDIALLPEYRKQGIGSFLLEGILAEGRREGVAVTLHVEKFNPALRLYQRLGFSPVQDRGVYVLMERPPGGGER